VALTTAMNWEIKHLDATIFFNGKINEKVFMF
jgi:hypothetical protein